MEESKKKYSSVYSELAAVDVSRLEQKKGTRNDSPKFISWATAWHAVKEIFPRAKYEFLKPSLVIGDGDNIGLMDDPSKNYFTDGKTAWVEVVVDIPGNSDDQVPERAHVSLPIMDFRNNSITIDKITSFDVNNSQMRALTKALAMCGLGYQMWVKDDVLARLGDDLATDAKSVEKGTAKPAEKAGVNKDAGKTPSKGKNPSKPKAEKTVELDILTDTHENWEKVLGYVSANKEKGIEQIVKDLSVKYKISDEVKVALADTIED